MIVTNHGPNTATNVVVRTTGWECQGHTWSAASCKRIPDRYDPTKPMSFDMTLDPIPPGGHAEFPIVTTIPDENGGTIRTTSEVVSSDQFDTGSVPGSCNDGWHPQPDCMSDVVTLNS
ncbi:hypothetical protein ACFQ9X_02630 [Catenulispora yoronensis]